MRNLKINYLALTASVFAFTTAASTMAGELQKLISFAGAENEMAFCVLSIIFGFGLLFTSFEKA